jgi:hypothetical protein
MERPHIANGLPNTKRPAIPQLLCHSYATTGFNTLLAEMKVRDHNIVFLFHTIGPLTFTTIIIAYAASYLVTHPLGCLEFRQGFRVSLRSERSATSPY